MAKKAKRCVYCGSFYNTFVSSKCCRPCYDYNRRQERDGNEKKPERQWPEEVCIRIAADVIKKDREEGLTVYGVNLLALDRTDGRSTS